ncbi:class I SAM-dependent methyltransferase [Nemorincola caseinilytica]|uniref:class I SAM-dependent methyltransferase n=1 Tax=Nemorincola caseinilytica TaxID=2054315 RepID=UPI0031E7D2BC
MAKKYRYITKECLFCNSTNEADHPIVYQKNFRDEDLDAGVFSARRTADHFHYDMVRCSKTGLLFSRHILDDEALNELYKGSVVTFGEQTEFIKRDYWRPIADKVGGWQRKRALDIGCSNGFFMEVLKDNGYEEVHGVEPGTEPKAIARADIRDNIYTGFYGPGLYPENHFDLITCFQTLDHLSDPLGMLRNMLYNTKPGGHVYMIMHNTNALQAKIFGERSPIIDVEHIYLFNKENLSELCRKAGFKVTSVFDVKNGYPMSYWVRMSPLPMKKMWVGTLKVLGMYEKMLDINAGNMGIILEKV